MGVHRTASLSGLNSNELYSLHYPDSILKFVSFDFSHFMRRCTEFYKRCEAAGEYKIEEAVAIRNSVGACHKFVEANLHGIYEKIIPDFFIEYICRERGIGTATLWNSLINAQNSLEKTLFARLTEYRHNKAVNRWVDLLKIQEYAKRKLDFVFGEKAELATAAAKRDYFDLTFSVAANELGYPLDRFSAARLYSVGRLPSSPFIVSSAAREIAKSTLAGLEYPDSEPARFSGISSDSEAMDVFASIKNLIPEKTDAVLGMVIKAMRSMPKRVYVADSFKAVIDLEIDLIIESGAVLQHCERCGEYFLRDSEYDYDYCSAPKIGGRTCLEISTTLPPRTPKEIEELDEMTSQLYTYMSKRINVDLTQRDFAEWYQYFMAIKENIAHHRLSIAEFRDFEKYSKELHFAKPAPPESPAQTEPQKPEENQEKSKTETSDEPVVKPFVFERIDRSALYEQENKRRRREREEQAEQSQEIKPSIEDIAKDAKPTVKVMKAQDAESIDFSVFENPFDGAFDDTISELEEVKSRDLKPLDSIFSFGADDNDDDLRQSSEPLSERLNATTAAQSGNTRTDKEAHISSKSGSTAEKNVSTDKADKVQGEAAELGGGFEKELAKASYIREAGTRRGYAAGMYRRTAETTAVGEVDFPAAELQNEQDEPFSEIQSDGAGRMTESDFDILPASTSPVITAEPAPKPKHTAENPRTTREKKSPPRITLGEQKATTNKTKRLLDGIMNPVKNHNPFINDD